jgi:hypothetical protein
VAEAKNQVIMLALARLIGPKAARSVGNAISADTAGAVAQQATHALGWLAIQAGVGGVTGAQDKVVNNLVNGRPWDEGVAGAAGQGAGQYAGMGAVGAIHGGIAQARGTMAERAQAAQAKPAEPPKVPTPD